MVTRREIASVFVVPWRRAEPVGTAVDRRISAAGDVVTRSTNHTIRVVTRREAARPPSRHHCLRHRLDERLSTDKSHDSISFTCCHHRQLSHSRGQLTPRRRNPSLGHQRRSPARRRRVQAAPDGYSPIPEWAGQTHAPRVAVSVLCPSRPSPQESPTAIRSSSSPMAASCSSSSPGV